MCSGLLGQKTCLCSEIILKLNPQKTTMGRWARRTSSWPHAEDRPLNRTRERDERLWDGRDQPGKDTWSRLVLGDLQLESPHQTCRLPRGPGQGGLSLWTALLRPTRPHWNTALRPPGPRIEDPSLLSAL